MIDFEAASKRLEASGAKVASAACLLVARSSEPTDIGLMPYEVINGYVIRTTDYGSTVSEWTETVHETTFRSPEQLDGWLHKLSLCNDEPWNSNQLGMLTSMVQTYAVSGVNHG